MAEYKLAESARGVHSKKLTAETVDTVEWEGYVPGVEVLSSGTAEVYFTVDGSTPTVGGENCYGMPATESARTVPGSGDRTHNTVVKLISTGTPEYSVHRSPDGSPRLLAL